MYAGAIVVGLPPEPSSGICAPFNCNNDPVFGVITEYQQVYSSTSFPGRLTITGIDFFHTAAPFPVSVNAASYTLRFSTTSKSVVGTGSLLSGLSNTLSNNIGADDQLFFSGTLSGLIPIGGKLAIVGTAPFSYDPANGNLLLDISITGAAASPGVGGLDLHNYNIDPGTTLFGRAFTESGGSVGVKQVNDRGGLVTQFDVVTPEPALALPIALVLIGFKRIRDRQKILQRTA
jgi:hypothetical protein